MLKMANCESWTVFTVDGKLGRVKFIANQRLAIDEYFDINSYKQINIRRMELSRMWWDSVCGDT